jgi:RNA polymerase-binding transcription factor DksA
VAGRRRPLPLLGKAREKRMSEIDEVKGSLHGELYHVLDRLRDLGGAVVFEDDELIEAGGDVVRSSEDRELSFAVRSRLVERANRLADALERVRGGQYGICEECGEAIASARLRAIPEAATCVACQHALEQIARRVAAVNN